MTLASPKSAHHVPDHARYLIKQHSYTQQYSQIYFQRLSILRPVILARAHEKWRKITLHERAMSFAHSCYIVAGVLGANHEAEFVPRLLDLQEGKKSIIIGTIYTDMASKPNILRELSAEPVEKYQVQPEDRYMVEDESGRITLSITPYDNTQCPIITGIVIGLLGHEMPSGDFWVEDICFPELPEQTAIPKKIFECKKYVAFISGLSYDPNNPSLTLNFDILLEYLQNFTEHHHHKATIERLIVAGNSIASRDKPAKSTKSRLGSSTTVRMDLVATKTLDLLFNEYFRGIMPIDIMPGESDPCNIALPQQPIHKSLFSTSKDFVTTVTNPYQFEVDGINITGTSGQNINDIFKYIPHSEDRLAMAELTLKSRHIAPTAPDTLWCYPFYDKDPFIIEKCPHVYFIGNQPYYKTKTTHGPAGQNVRIVLLPSFSKTSSMVLLDIASLDCEIVQMDV